MDLTKAYGCFSQYYISGVNTHPMNKDLKDSRTTEQVVSSSSVMQKLLEQNQKVLELLEKKLEQNSLLIKELKGQQRTNLYI